MVYFPPGLFIAAPAFSYQGSGEREMAYADFKSYLQANYKDMLENEITALVGKSYDGGSFRPFHTLSVCEQKAENAEIKSIRCHDDIGPLIKIEINVTADIVTLGLGTRKYEATRKNKWFTVTVQAILKNGLHNMTVLSTEEYFSGTFDKEDSLDEYLIPYIYAEDLEDIADDFTEFFCQDAVYDGWQMPIGHILQEMEIEYYRADLPEDEFGRMYFRPATEMVEERHFYPHLYDTAESVEKELQPGTMLISKKRSFMGNVGSTLNTIAHEIIHWEKHKKFFEILSLLNQEETKLSCKVTPDVSPDTLQGIEKAVWWAEWQANALAPRILMPRVLFNDIFPKIFNEQYNHPYFHLGEVMECTLLNVAKCFGVSRYEAKLRALQLGYKCAEGVFLHVNGQYMTPYAFNPDALDDYQTFLLDEKNFERIYEEDESFAALFESGAFVYLGYLVCINDEKYVKYLGEGNGYALTQYGLDHVDECCLKFNRSYSLNKSPGDYYNMCYLCQNIKAASFSEMRYIDEKDKQEKIALAKEMQKKQREGEKMMAIFRELPNSFSGTLKAHMNRLKALNPTTGKMRKMTITELAIRTGFSTDYIGQLTKDGKGVSLNAVCAICISLHLEPLFSDDLIRKAKTNFSDDTEGYIQQSIVHENYMETLDKCNERLTVLGYKPWGGKALEAV